MFPRSKVIQVSYRHVLLTQKAVECYLNTNITEKESQEAHSFLYEIDHILEAWGEGNLCNVQLAT